MEEDIEKLIENERLGFDRTKIGSQDYSQTVSNIFIQILIFIFTFIGLFIFFELISPLFHKVNSINTNKTSLEILSKGLNNLSAGINNTMNNLKFALVFSPLVFLLTRRIYKYLIIQIRNMILKSKANKKNKLYGHFLDFEE